MKRNKDLKRKKGSSNENTMTEKFSEKVSCNFFFFYSSKYG